MPRQLLHLSIPIYNLGYLKGSSTGKFQVLCCNNELAAVEELVWDWWGLEFRRLKKKKKKWKFKEKKSTRLQSKQGTAELFKLQHKSKKQIFIWSFVQGCIKLFFFQNKNGMLPCTLVAPMSKKIQFIILSILILNQLHNMGWHLSVVVHLNNKCGN